MLKKVVWLFSLLLSLTLSRKCSTLEWFSAGWFAFCVHTFCWHILEWGIWLVQVSPAGEWVPWQSKVPKVEVETHKVAAADLVIPTIDTVRHESLLYTWLAEHKPLVLCGPPGSGKTMTLFSALRALPDMEVNLHSAFSTCLLMLLFFCLLSISVCKAFQTDLKTVYFLTSSFLLKFLICNSSLWIAVKIFRCMFIKAWS